MRISKLSKELQKSLKEFSTLKRPCLVRDFIYDRLYHPTNGYFCRNDVQIGELESPINFKNMLGYQEYMSELSEKYPKNAWLTPSEQFRPWYGMTIGNYIQNVIDLDIKNERAKRTSTNRSGQKIAASISFQETVRENLRNSGTIV